MAALYLFMATCIMSLFKEGFVFMDRKNGYYKKENRYSNRKLFIKAFLCVVGIIILGFIAFTYRDYKIREAKEPYVRIEEVRPILTAFVEVKNGENGLVSELSGAVSVEDILEIEDEDDSEYLTYGTLIHILEYFPVEDLAVLKTYKEADWYVGLEDWNRILLQMTDKYGAGKIRLQEQVILGDSDNIIDEEGNALPKDMVLTKEAVYSNQFWNIEQYLFCNVEALCYKNRIVTIIGLAKGKESVENVYLADSSKEEIHLFWNGYHLRYPTDSIKHGNDLANGVYGRIVDIIFDEGKVTIGKEKEEYIHGKLLQVTDTTMEIEGCGIFPMDEEMAIYKLYGELQSEEKTALRIGYSFTDFVIDDGKIAACLMMKEEDMEYIRVLLKNSNMEGRYHQSILAYCDRECEVIVFKDGVEEERRSVRQGEEIWIEPDDLEIKSERIKIVPAVLSATTTIESISRNQGIPAYMGTLEITREEEGLLIINEVLLEDYLCKVVPSEMPATYPKEALKAQAICARTYAYGKMLQTGLPDLGAHVDDSTGFQVYNNIREQIAATEAVKATHNKIAVYEEQPIGAYYYSTSCGIGTNTEIWHGSGESPAYLRSIEIGREAFESIGENLIHEENFREWIMNANPSHYEANEGWYRWQYKVKAIDIEHMEEVLKNRYANNPNLILIQNEDGEFESKEIEKLGNILDICITKRNAGGVADELVITGEKAVIKVISELNIRYVLSDGVTQVTRQTLDTPAASSTLPSAYIVIDTIKEDGNVTGYEITGGGFGHGVGMSQNGAANMALDGKTSEEILTFFYPGVTVKTLQVGD